MESVFADQIRFLVRKGNVSWQKHCLQRIFERGISRNEILETILYGNEIKTYPQDKPFPSFLFLMFISGKPVHVVVAFNRHEKMIYIITVYEPTLEYFEKDFQTRRKT